METSGLFSLFRGALAAVTRWSPFVPLLFTKQAHKCRTNTKCCGIWESRYVILRAFRHEIFAAPAVKGAAFFGKPSNRGGFLTPPSKHRYDFRLIPNCTLAEIQPSAIADQIGQSIPGKGIVACTGLPLGGQKCEVELPQSSLAKSAATQAPAPSSSQDDASHASNAVHG